MFLTALLAATLAAPVPKQKPATVYFPTSVGSKRVMQNARDGETWEVTEEVTKVEEQDGTHTVTMEWRNGENVITSVYEVSATGVVDANKARGRETLLDLGVKSGESWQFKLNAPGGALPPPTPSARRRS